MIFEVITIIYISLCQMNQIFLFTHLPILLHFCCYYIIQHISYFIVRMLEFNNINLHLALCFLLFLLFISYWNSFWLRSHLHEMIYTLPNKAIVLRLKSWIEIVRLCWQQGTFVYYLLTLPLNILEILRRILNLKWFFLLIIRSLLDIHMVKERTIRSTQWIQKSK